MMTYIPGSVPFTFRVLYGETREIVDTIYAVDKLDAYAQINTKYPDATDIVKLKP